MLHSGRYATSSAAVIGLGYPYRCMGVVVHGTLYLKSFAIPCEWRSLAI